MRAALIAVALAVVSCATETPHDSLTWTAAMIPGTYLELIDTYRVEQYAFSRRGTVSATFGTRDLLAGPILEWRFRRGRLQIIDRGKVMEEFTLLRMDQNTVTVRRSNGSTDRFRYSHEKS